MRDDINTDQVCLYSHTRGGYYTLKLATTFNRQDKDVACYVSYSPHLQDPNAPEPMQFYGYAKEIDEFKIPSRCSSAMRIRLKAAMHAS